MFASVYACACKCAFVRAGVSMCTCMSMYISCVCRGWLLVPAGSGNTRYLCSLQPHVTSAHVCFSGNIRISDLGLAVELKEGQTKTKGYAGTPGKVLGARMRAACPRGQGEVSGILGVSVTWGAQQCDGRGFTRKRFPHPSE